MLRYDFVRVTPEDVSTDPKTGERLAANQVPSVLPTGTPSQTPTTSAGDASVSKFDFVDLDRPPTGTSREGPAVAFSGRNLEQARQIAKGVLGIRPALVVLPYVDRVSATRDGNALFVSAPAQAEILRVEYDAEAQRFGEVVPIPVKDDGTRDAAIDALVNTYFSESATHLQGRAVDPSAFTLPYEPASTCLNCHTESHRAWSHSRHAGALDTLANKNRLVPECLPCHSTAFRATLVWSPQAAATKESVSCASCHGEGLRHVVTQKKTDIGSGKGEAVCVSCHTRQASPRFNYEAALKKIVH